MSSIIKKSGQSWKMRVSIFGIIISGALMFSGSFIGRTNSQFDLYPLIPVGALIGMLSFIFAIFSIRCPNCKDKWFWRAVSKRDKNNWLIWLENQSNCSECNKKFK
jgi:Na+/melibiose symporter-like transporter